jgi:uncharacterized protein (TIGR00251 family)
MSGACAYDSGMAGRSLCLVPKSGGFALAVKVVPGASRRRIAGAYGDGIKVTVTAKPVDGAANEAILKLLGEFLRIPTSQIQITRGQTNPRKEILIMGLPAEAIAQRLFPPDP